MKPYESDGTRVRAMYRLSMSPGRDRALELCFGTQPILTDAGRDSGRVVSCELRSGATSIEADRGRACVADYRHAMPFAPGSFDLVVLHGTLDRMIDADPGMRSRQAVGDFVTRIASVLAPGGTLAACVANRTGFSRFVRMMQSRHYVPAEGAASLSIRSWRALLARAGYGSVEIFNVLPSAASPLRLVSTDADISRIAFRRELETMRASLDAPRYAARRALVELALNRYLEESMLLLAVRT